jgi:hypothetical protein
MIKKAEVNRETKKERKNQTKKKQSNLGYSFVRNALIVCRVPKCHLSFIVAVVTWAIAPSPLRVAQTRVIARHGTQLDAL